MSKNIRITTYMKLIQKGLFPKTEKVDGVFLAFPNFSYYDRSGTVELYRLNPKKVYCIIGKIGKRKETLDSILKKIKKGNKVNISDDTKVLLPLTDDFLISYKLTPLKGTYVATKLLHLRIKLVGPMSGTQLHKLLVKAGIVE